MSSEESNLTFNIYDNSILNHDLSHCIVSCSSSIASIREHHVQIIFLVSILANTVETFIDHLNVLHTYITNNVILLYDETTKFFASTTVMTGNY